MLIKLFFVIVLFSITIVIFRSWRFLQIGERLVSTNDFPRSSSVGNGPKTLDYAVLGDSTAVGVGASKHEATYSYQFASELATQRSATVKVTIIAVSGARLNDVITLQLPQLKKLKPDLVTISIGGNDATHLTNSKEYTESFTKLLSELQSLKIKEAYISNTPDMHRIPALPTLAWLLSGWRSKVQNQLTEALIEKSPYIKVDIYNSAKLHGLPDYAPDRFHPNDQGYERWTKTFIASLN